VEVKKVALITGITGQDGAYLARFLLQRDYDVYGVFRRLSTPNFWRLQYLGVFDQVHLIPADLIDATSITEALQASRPQEVYHLAAQSFVGTSYEQPVGTGEVTGLGVTRMLEAVRIFDPQIRFYQASTSELYGNGSDPPQTEETPFRPASPYGAAKLYGYWMTQMYRGAYQMFAVNGILFNHESPLRGLEFVTRKISNGVVKIALGLDTDLRLGNLNAQRDWGYAPEYVEAMWLSLQQNRPDDYVIATNEAHSVLEFVQEAFAVVDLPWEPHVSVDKQLLRPLDIALLRGDYSKARRTLGWQPATTFRELVRIMVKEDLAQWERWLRGERFPWDAPFFPNEARILSGRARRPGGS
jgi:GDPmannose 4,6-dehydratase